MNARILGNRYEVGRLLGYGGMAEVHLARDTRLDRDVAIKILRSDLARDHTFQVRFRREAQSAASLNHPAIVSVYDTGSDPTTDPATPYIVMEFVEGQTLRDLLRQEEVLEPPQAMRIVAEMCGALDFSHRNGIVHRDVKPGNVMITPAGRVKVMDFGIARAVSDSAATMTATAAVVGTAQYLSPEQARGESVDARSDVYAVGCVLYELLTGGPPFTGDSPVAVAYQHVRELPNAPSRVNAAIPPALDAITMKALSKNPANRYQSAAEMQDDLDRAIIGERVHAAPVLSEEEATTVIPSMPPVPVTSKASTVEDDNPDRKSGVSRRTWALAAALVALIVIIAFFIVPALFSGNEDPTTPSGPSASSASASNIAVPSLTGQTPEEATDTLKKAGLEVGEITQVASSVGQKDKVVDQNPGADDEVAEGTKVDLSVGAGPTQVAIPDLVGMTKDDAQQALEQAGLTASFIDQDGPETPGTVVSSSPGGGTSAPESSTVTVFVSTGKIPVPEVIGDTQEDAIKKLADAGFTNVNPFADPALEGAPGTVGGQDPASGNHLPSTQINLGIVTQPAPSTTSAPSTSAPSTSAPSTSAESSAAAPSTSAAPPSASPGA